MKFTSQNGWPAYGNDTSHFTRFDAGGRSWWAANADVAVCAAEFITQFDKTVERVVQPGEVYDDWSYNPDLRPIRGQTTGYSNHDSATAWDLNATRHPRGVHHTFTDAQAVAFRRIRESITDDYGNPVFRLGMDYSSASTVDDMHVEINANPVRVNQAADKLRAKARNEDDGMANITPEQFAQLLADSEIELSESAARNMSTSATPRKKGDKVSVSYLLQWGGAGAYREWNDVLEIAKNLSDTKQQVDALVGAVKALTLEVAALKGGPTA